MRSPRPTSLLLAAAMVAALAGTTLPASAEEASPEPATVEQQIPEARPVKTGEDVVELAEQDVMPEDLGRALVDDGVVDAAALEAAAAAGAPAAAAPADAATTAAPAPEEPAPADATTEEPADSPTQDAARTAAGQADATAAEAVPQELTVTVAASVPEAEVAIAGVTWPRSDATADLKVYLRQRSDGAWTDWQAMEISSLEADAPSPNDGTEPMAVIGADEVEVALVAPEGVDAPKPELTVVDPGSSPADDEAELDAAANTVPAGGTAPVVSGAPTIYSRADWGADERMMAWKPWSAQTQGAVIHHTAGSNGYTAAQVPGILRGIYHYHAVTRGWGDIGYNVLVDAFGRAWEGRAGGLDSSIVGAHATGYNTATFGISVLGNFDLVQVPQAAFDTVARVTAWKFDMNGVDARGRMTVSGRTHNAVIGHRDVAAKSCPGNYFYPRLGELTNLIAAYQGRLNVPAVPSVIDHDLDGDGIVDLAVRTGSVVSLWSTQDVPGAPAWRATRRGHGWVPQRTLAPTDWDGDKIDDLMLIDAAGRLFLYPGLGSGRFAPKAQIGKGWGSIDLVATGGDWDGDGTADLLGRTKADGRLVLYRGNGRGGFAGSRTIGTGWHKMRQLAVVENYHQGRPAVLAVDTTGRLLAYRGDGAGQFSGTPAAYGRGWDGMTDIATAGQWDGSGGDDIAALDRSGNLWIYPTDGTSGIRARTRLVTGMSAEAFIGPATDKEGQGVWAVTRTGELRQYRSTPTVAPRTTATTVPLAAADKRIVVPGDWDGDRRADLIVHKADGRLLLHRGLGGGTFDGAGRLIGNGWNIFDDVVGAGDFFRDGRPVLLGYTRSTGTVTAYPGTGRGGFAASQTVGRGYTGYDAVAADVWSTSSRTPSVILRGDTSKSLFHFPGGYGTSLGLRTTIGLGWGSMSSIVAAGDVDGDGAPDLAAVNGRDVLLYPTDGRLGFRSPVRLGTLPSGAGGAR